MSFELSLILNVLLLAVFCTLLVEKNHFKKTRPIVFIIIGIYIVYYLFWCVLRGGT